MQAFSNCISSRESQGRLEWKGELLWSLSVLAQLPAVSTSSAKLLTI